MKPVLVDFFCGAGGCTEGYKRAGFFVVGIDIEPQPDYCGDQFVQMDALEALRILLDGGTIAGYRLEDVAAFHASPPCQAFTSLSVMHNARKHDDLLTPTRELLDQTDLPYVIENVPGAPVIGHVTLCGSSFGLGVKKYDRELRRHRHFETNFPVMVPPCQHSKATIGIYGDHARDRRRKPGVRDRGVDFPDSEKMDLAREAMGMPWATRWKGLSQAIPPAYTEHIGGYLMTHCELCRQNAVGHDAQGAATVSGSGVPENDGDESVGIFPLNALGPDEGGLRITELAGRVGHGTVHTDAVGERESGHGPHHALPAPDVKDAA